MTRLFDTIVIVDWSARSTPSPAAPSADAVWIGVAHGAENDAPSYCRTRAEAMDWIANVLAEEIGAGRRVLVGFDFPFGYPRGFAAAITGEPDALALWSHLADVIVDGPCNANNRFEVAAALNARLPGIGPFWGRPSAHPLADLPERGSLRQGHGLPERRLVEERVRSAQTAWKLYTTGSVGGQVLTGLAAMQRLRGDLHIGRNVAVWPFETGLDVPRTPVVLAEIYPSLLAQAVMAAMTVDEIKDAVQVRVTAAAFAALDAGGGLALLFAPRLDAVQAGIVTLEEGWILGVGFEAELRAAAETPATPKLRNDCFALPPGIAWVPVDSALARLRAGLAPVTGVETVPLISAAGRILSEPLVACRAHPPSANSAVDGYGFAFDSAGSGPCVLPLATGRAAAGVPYAAPVPPGRALRILTGASLPEGVDTVVLDEDVARHGDRIRFEHGLKRQANTRAAGEDVGAGVAIFPAGHRLTPQDLALAAAVGLGAVPVRRPLRVGVLSTGDEIRPPGTPVAGHQIHDANRPMLLAMLRAWHMTPVDLGQTPDTGPHVAAALDLGARQTDAILTTGGASAGDEDHVSRLLAERGELRTWRIAVKPGRPLALGLWAGVPVFGLPGNPVAAFVCALIFGRPALSRLAGTPWADPVGIVVPAAFEKAKKAGRREYLRARLDNNGHAEVFASEGSGRISGLVWARGLVELEDGPRMVRAGDPVRYLPFAEFGL